MNSITICLTGHRPTKIGGYNNYSPLNLAIATKLREKLLSYLNQGNKVHAISGVALGSDTLFALVVLKLKRQGYNIKLECAIPCNNHGSKWPHDSQELYKSILNSADKTTLVTDKSYMPYLMQIRNKYMVDNADLVIAVWDGSPGGTKNCIDYAKEQCKEVCILNPNTLVC